MFVGNLDGTIDLDDLSVHETLNHAVDTAREDDLHHHDGEVFIYECRPVKRLSRKTIVEEDLS